MRTLSEIREDALKAIQSRKPPTERYEEIEKVLDELYDVTGQYEPSLHLRNILEAFCRQAMEAPRPPGGQQAGLDHCWASRVPPSIIKELRWFAREFEEELRRK